MKQSILQRLAERADLPGEGLPRQPLLELLGDGRVLIENHQGILEYGSCRIQVRVSYGSLQICGENLQLCRMQGNLLVISGKIQEILLVRGRV